MAEDLIDLLFVLGSTPPFVALWLYVGASYMTLAFSFCLMMSLHLGLCLNDLANGVALGPDASLYSRFAAETRY